MSATSCTRNRLAAAIRRNTGAGREGAVGDARFEEIRAERAWFAIDAGKPCGAIAQRICVGRARRHRRRALAAGLAGIEPTLLVGERIYPWPSRLGHGAAQGYCGA